MVFCPKKLDNTEENAPGARFFSSLDFSQVSRSSYLPGAQRLDWRTACSTSDSQMAPAVSSTAP
ncbi:hypothetical protein MASSI9I_50549 [Massilia sp. 9I]|nr:hypothetical protein MASSI9I_50549 [Massilia sp. 9I]